MSFTGALMSLLMDSHKVQERILRKHIGLSSATRDPRAAWSEWVPDFQIFVGPGPVRPQISKFSGFGPWIPDCNIKI